MNSEPRTIRPEEVADFLRVDSVAFGGEPSEDKLSAGMAVLDPDRALGIFEAGRVVASAAVVPFELTLPGLTTIPAPGVTYVGVLPTHRRRGYLRSLMRRQLGDLHAEGAALSILYSSESGIYGRFGYGVATHEQRLEIDRHQAAFRRPVAESGRMQLLDRAAALETLPVIHDRFVTMQPGAITRPRKVWDLFMLSASDEKAAGRFQVLYSDGGDAPLGYALYRVDRRWEQGFARFTLTVDELIALSPEAYAVLWQYCFNVDLVRTIQAPNCSVDEPLRWLLASPRNLRVLARGDALWVRLIDISRALAARRYSGSGRLVFDVQDEFLPQNTGRYLLESTEGEARCTRAGGAADLALAVDDLAAVFLSGTTFATLARAGRVQELQSGALHLADALFGSGTAPWCPTHF